MKNDNHPYQSIYKTLTALLILLTIYTAVTPEIVSAQTKVEAVSQDFFSEKVREGRDLIDQREWARAADIFREAVEKSPDHKSADAALYWLAFCYKKQKKFKEAFAALDRLLVKFPASLWAGDAQVMKMEIAPHDGERYNSNIGAINSKVPPGKFSSELQSKVISETTSKSGQNMTIKDKPGLGERLPLDRADEIKLAAFQSLLTADPQRAIETMGEVLKPDSQASETLKQEILRVWRNPRLFASQALTSSITQSIGVKEFAALLRETLVKSFQNETNSKIRKEIIYVLAALADSPSNDYLKKLYAAENDREIKKAIINAFSSSANIFYAFNTVQIQKAELGALREQTRKIQFDILLEIVRTEKDIELRRLTLSHLLRFQSWATSEQAIEIMASLYDVESDEEFKLFVIRALAESRQNRATGKLLQIAKNDKSDKLRLEAIYSLRTSKDPEVLKFLEDLIK
ncbi:MAG TPA: HEAT repeat domain-containing protein [Pyrinomonadaceae bacterium]|jgi:tetratricopeptide (TPR) repeat protein